jgi:hypothetical protein
LHKLQILQKTFAWSGEQAEKAAMSGCEYLDTRTINQWATPVAVKSLTD